MWVVGKSLVGVDRPSEEVSAVNEGEAKEKLAQILRTHVAVYKEFTQQFGPLMRMERWVATLEDGKWPSGGEGLNWLWSVAWAPGVGADRDVWLFWAREYPTPAAEEKAVA